LAPCWGDPLVESTPPPRGVRTEARVQLQLIRREERALRAIVQPEVRTYLLLRSILWQLAAIAEGLRPDLDEDDGAWSSTKGSGSTGGSGNTAAAKQQQRGAAANDPGCWGARDILVAGLCTLRLLRANMYYLRAAGVSPGTVGLGTSSGGSSS
ncbi:unnamed protein product, partial [Ectocarpus fasciculatus]